MRRVTDISEYGNRNTIAGYIARARMEVRSAEAYVDGYDFERAADNIRRAIEALTSASILNERMINHFNGGKEDEKGLFAGA